MLKQWNWKLIFSINNIDAFRRKNSKDVDQTLIIFKNYRNLDANDEERIYKTYSINGKINLDEPIEWNELIQRGSNYCEYRIYRYESSNCRFFRCRTRNIPLKEELLTKILEEEIYWQELATTFYWVGNSLFAEVNLKVQ